MSRVALIGENSFGYIDKLLDIWNDGDCAVLIDWRIPFSTAVEMMREANVNKCFIEKQQYDKISYDSPDSIDFFPFERNNNSAEPLSQEIFSKFQPSYERTEAIMLYSSGTTGKSKGIILSHYDLNSNADAIIDYMQPDAKDCIYIARALSHSTTITGELLVALKSKMKIIMAPTIVPPRYILNNI